MTISIEVYGPDESIQPRTICGLAMHTVEYINLYLTFVFYLEKYTQPAIVMCSLLVAVCISAYSTMLLVALHLLP